MTTSDRRQSPRFPVASSEHDRAERLADECAELRQKVKDLGLECGRLREQVAQSWDARSELAHARDHWHRIAREARDEQTAWLKQHDAECLPMRAELSDLRARLATEKAEKDNALRDLARACSARNRAVERAQELWDRLGGLLDAIAGEFERSVHHHRGPRGGQQVAFFGDFQSVGPSVVGRMEWWAREFRNALGAMSPVGSAISDAKRVADAHAAEVEKFCEEGGEE
jgi:hypothetical protein